jgi:hypothetical protein
VTAPLQREPPQTRSLAGQAQCRCLLHRIPGEFWPQPKQTAGPEPALGTRVASQRLLVGR